MIVSWNWLKDYVSLDMPQDELELRLAMAGLNHESTEKVGDDLAIDLEVTSNRPDCLGHLGVAREVGVLWDQPVNIPTPSPKEASNPVSKLTKVRIECPELCYRYTARIIRGVKIGPSPDWLSQRLTTIGIASINNVVDISNYVLMECGQPLHAFDFKELVGGEIIVREAIQNEQFEAIDHKTYDLQPGMCVIADKDGAIALGGVMGGADTEVSNKTTDLLIEAAEFAPLSIRNTARKLVLHSPSSYRFERGVDPEGVNWASRRCCELILDIAGGELAAGVVDVGREVAPREPIVLRQSQLPRILGITVEANEVRRILESLGCSNVEAKTETIQVSPPSWRRDLTREIDLIEEVARIHGYDKIPEDVAVPMVPSHRSDLDRVEEEVRRVLTAAGFDEAMMCSLVPRRWYDAVDFWTEAEPIVSGTPIRGVLEKVWQGTHSDCLRRSLIPSLLESRRYNESLANPMIELFETARLYLASKDELRSEPLVMGVTSGGTYHELKGVIEGLVQTLNPNAEVQTRDTSLGLLDRAKSCEVQINGQRLGYLGEVSQDALEQFHLRSSTTVAEIDISVLAHLAELIPQYVPQSSYPPIARDFNFIVDESLRWSDLSTTVRAAAGEILEHVEYQETFRDPKRDGAGKKRVLLTVTLRSDERTLTGEEADETSKAIVNACHQEHGGKLLG